MLLTSDVTTEVTKEVADVAADAVQDISNLQQFINDSIPSIIGFGIKVVLAFLFFLIGSRLIKLVRKIVQKSLERASADKGVSQFVDSLLKFGCYTLLIFLIFEEFGGDASSVAALIASAGVAIGLAVQGSLSNLAGGVLILLLKPFSVGDYIVEDAGKNEGTVKEIQMFYTKLATIDNKTIVIPNGTLANNSLTNVTAQERRRLDLTVGISYQSDLKKAKEVIETLIRQDEATLQNEEIAVYVDALGESSVVIGSRHWVKTEEYWPAKWRLLEAIKLTLDENEIEIPYPQVTVHQG